MAKDVNCGLGQEEKRPRPSVSPALPVSVLTTPGLVTVLIPCVGQLEYTKLCVPSVLRHSRMILNRLMP